AASSAGERPTRRSFASGGTKPASSRSSAAAGYFAAQPPHAVRSVSFTAAVAVCTPLNVPTPETRQRRPKPPSPEGRGGAFSDPPRQVRGKCRETFTSQGGARVPPPPPPSRGAS